MKNLVSGIAIALLLGAIYTAPVQAQTYDGVTPAEETVCGELMADGVTKGLYGLCVAYCEAQDTTYEEMDTESNPDDQILAVYNKRKKETDPPMPCTVPLDNECPVFDQAFVDMLDGYSDYDGAEHVNFYGEPVSSCTIFGKYILEGSWIEVRESSPYALKREARELWVKGVAVSPPSPVVL